MKIVNIIIFVLCSIGLMAQEFPGKPGNIAVIQDARIDSLMHAHQQLNKVYTDIEGFRVQIFMDSGNDAVQKAEDIIVKFKEENPDLPVYLSFGQPYYRIRVGDLRNRIEAEGVLRRIIGRYNQAFIVKDKINFPQLISFPNQNQNL
ncbi:MAG: SPOR domain-containing protein [Bacteroidetes bacterium]|nr:SPOR domain-containing protein [Bacteroidota bacterium]